MRNPQTTAWLVVLISFALFCVLCATSTFGAYWFLFESGVPLTARLTVSRGAVTVSRPDLSYVVNNASSKNLLTTNSTLQTDANSQAYISFEDGYSGQFVGTVFLLENSSITLTEATRPRFEWSREGYVVLLGDSSGHFAVDLTPPAHRSMALTLRADAGTALLDTAGSYMVDALDQQIQLYTKSGKGLLYALPDRKAQGEVVPNMQGVLETGKQEVSLRPYMADMLNLADPGPPQPSFGPETNDDSNNSLPLFWACESAASSPNEIQGAWQRTHLDKSVVLEFVRRGLGPAGEPLGHADVGCRFWFPRNPLGLDVNLYTSLSIRLKMKIMYQDVTTCGIAGSECPIMLEMRYVDINKQTQFWRQGFYADRPVSDTYIQRCDTCPHDHQQITKDAWYIYETGDLKQQFPPDKMIDYVEYVRVYASGHQFEVALSDFTVLGGKPVPQAAGGN